MIKPWMWLGAVVSVGLVLVVGLVWRHPIQPAINDYQSCVDNGYPVTQSYPSTCQTPDGRVFTQPVSPPIENPL